MDYKKINYSAQEAFVNDNREEYDALVARFEAADETLTTAEVAQMYYSTPFAGYKPLADLVKTANHLYKIRDYRVSYFMYRDALVQDPCSLLLLKKAANASFFDVIDAEATRQLRARVAMLHEVIKETGDGETVETAYKVTQVADEYQILYDIYHVKDVISQNVVKRDGKEVYDEMTVQLLSEKTPRKVYFACYGETEEDMQDFFIRKKGY